MFEASDFASGLARHGAPPVVGPGWAGKSIVLAVKWLRHDLAIVFIDHITWPGRPYDVDDYSAAAEDVRDRVQVPDEFVDSAFTQETPCVSL